MKLLHLSTNDIAGGAALVAYRLHTGLRRRGLDSELLVVKAESGDPSVRTLDGGGSLLARLRRQLRLRQIRRDFAAYRRTRGPGHEQFSDDRSRYGAAVARAVPPADIVTLHWVAGMLDYRAFFGALPPAIPVVWLLSDMNPFTGGCHYDERCGRWASGCGACPQLGSADPADLSRQIWRRKEAAFGQLGDRRLHVVANNEWMAAQARRSPLLGRFPLSVIPNGLNSDTFAPRDRAFAREVLGIPQDARVVLFVAMATTNHRKGFSLLVQALGAMRDEVPGLFLVSLGRARTMPEVQVPHLALGEIKQERLLSLIYSAADLFAIPSLQDNQPNTVLEALACAVPVVGFDAGGIAEMVRPGVTGELVPVGDVPALRGAIAALLLDEGRRRALGAGARETVLREYRQEQQVERFCQLYRALHARAPGSLAPPAGAAG